MARKSKGTDAAPKERKKRERSPKAEAAITLARGEDQVAEFDKRLGRLATQTADVQAKKEALVASLTEARALLLQA